MTEKMPLQNRVTPFGDIVALPGRGMYTGNRGILHGDHRNIVRSSQVRRWIACSLEYKGYRRQLMRPHAWTELFFLDEVSAFAAGHRPCAACRPADFKRFTATWQTVFGERPLADVMDERLQRDRRDRGKKVTFRADISTLPDGTFIAIDGVAWLIWRGMLHRWADGGYTDEQSRPSSGEVEVLTPRSLVMILSAGYEPTVHASVNR